MQAWKIVSSYSAIKLVIIVLNNKTITVLNLAEDLLILASSALLAKHQVIKLFHMYVISQDNLLLKVQTFQKKIHNHPMEGHWKFLGEGGLKVKILEAKYEAKLEFPKGMRVPNKKPSVGVVWIFSGTARCPVHHLLATW